MEGSGVRNGAGRDVTVTPNGGGRDVTVTPNGGGRDVTVTPNGGGREVTVMPHGGRRKTSLYASTTAGRLQVDNSSLVTMVTVTGYD